MYYLCFLNKITVMREIFIHHRKYLTIDPYEICYYNITQVIYLSYFIY